MTIDRSGPGRLIRGDETLARLRAVDGGPQLYLVGGSVRDSLLGATPLDLDLAVDGPVATFAGGIDSDAVLHERFDTAEVSIDGRRVDLARTRSEKYRRPGSLPVVEPAGIEADLSRRDFTINAIAAPLDDPEALIDPCDGLEDLESGVIRVIHHGSFRDDPTRALRAARYAARLGFDVDHRTADLLLDVDLNTVSPDRTNSELELIAEEKTAVEALRLISAWKLLEFPDKDLETLAAAFEILEVSPWQGFCSRADVTKAVVSGDTIEDSRSLLDYPGSPSRACAEVRRHSTVEILLARAAGARWLDGWMSEWRDVNLKMTGDDLIAAGIPGGEAVGAGLDAALEAALDEGATGRKKQLLIALEASRSHLAEEEA
jgi:tRNA nucleotidyltransferase (CCA-adding enzyme)